jgi:hypothetical protein
MPAIPAKKTITLISTIVVVCITAVGAVIGVIGRNSFTPKIIDQAFGISRYVLSEISKQVDSGYSATFIFSQNSRPNAQLQFFAEKGQTVKVTISGNALGSQPTVFKVLIDNVPWEGDRNFPFNLVHGDITDKLRWDIPPGGNVHALRFLPGKLENDSVVVLDCLVVVYNK